ncbi:MAG TPA: bifunctional phosphoribosylaminoimidazolecarboxamide formyltransferase/IMP cyclohydrolase [Ornithinimicrobium sp.]|uniref:bifunctional phosphoribosylaminoimidazolecarboxamide formyltransferase/IMP cyclohydrolase n=1 Tax=Ornithinimicrobium sp. TaxID=1977084 RepID=UPI002B45C7C7|nr:bifunctional phosphoribosylaminoimidazolecarboxamide formyltransferase/IMP cyclohydrolase [Ornithinimicrobium sp.]HKJ12667.1 bifunctional phosphoribosylaminoimidazolecarboxamide formyltransferase/IMP cyclohydrolase [Ornithinimicrobium sp.]
MNASSESRRPVRRALISVYDKTGLAELARGLHHAGVRLVSTGSTAARIADAGVPVTPVEEVTGFEECLGGRVKTLHPAVHGGLLADQSNDEHTRSIADLGIEAFDLLVVNLYPFAQTVAAGTDVAGCIEQIDIGGPAMVRGAAKNHGSVAVVVDPTDYDEVLRAVGDQGFTLAQRQRLAAQAFRHTATYDTAVASWMAATLVPDHDGADVTPEWVAATWARSQVLRYGENPHQAAAVYLTSPGGPFGQGGLATAEQLHGKAMSYNNFVDADAALRAAHDHGTEPTVAIVKHNNPCGIAVGADVAQAHAKAHACDPVSAYGGVVASNQPVTTAMARGLADIFTEVVAAPGFEPEALELLSRKKNVRLLRVDAPITSAPEGRLISGGLLLQQPDDLAAATDSGGDDPTRWRRVAGPEAGESTLADLAFTWRACRAVKSNAILLGFQGASVGIGMGQVNRVDSAHLAVRRAGSRAAGSVAASDAFFPFADGLHVLLDAGVAAVVSPGGSVRDEEVVAAADAAGVSLYFTGTRHFAH